MKFSLLAVVAVAGLLSIAARSGTSESNEFRKFRGTWSCATCDAGNLEGKYEECEALGHKHSLKLYGGKYVNFLENERSEALVDGGGRHKTRMEVFGFYNALSNTIDVECYRIDGLWTSWCSMHARMDMCRHGAEHPATAMMEKAAR